MNSNAQAWVAALRSGDYNQGHLNLRRSDSFCCLGVACDLAVKDGLPIEVTNDGDEILYDGEVSFLPDSVVAWLSLSNASGAYSINRSLTRDNDCLGDSFTQIADTIETHPELFA